METFRRKLVTQGIIVILVLGALVSGVSFFAGQIRLARENSVALRGILFNRVGAIGSFAALKTDFEPRGKQALAALYKIVPVQGQIITLGKDFRVLAVQNNLDASFAWGTETKPTAESFGTVGFTLTVMGEYEKLRAFIGKLNNFRFLIVIDSLSLSRAPQGSLTILGRVFYR